MAPEETHPAPVDQGFPNPHAEHFEGERTPEEELEYRRQQLTRDVTAGKVDVGEPAPAADEVPTNPTGTERAAW